MQQSLPNLVAVHPYEGKAMVRVAIIEEEMHGKGDSTAFGCDP